VSLPQLWALFRRELAAYLLSPMSYLVWAVFLVAGGYLFATSIRDGGPASLDQTFNNLGMLLLFVAPLVTMRLVAEELKLGTLEVLMTDPVEETAIITSKYAASVTFFALMLAPTLAYPSILARIGQPDPGPLVAGYGGLFAMGASFLAVGLFASTLTANQIAAATLSFAALLVFWLLGRAADSIGPGKARDVLEYLSAFSRYRAFRLGIVDTRSLVYCATLSALCLFWAVRALGLRRVR
jgi:ABC-2 type transport system permease protein